MVKEREIRGKWNYKVYSRSNVGYAWQIPEADEVKEICEEICRLMNDEKRIDLQKYREDYPHLKIAIVEEEGEKVIKITNEMLRDGARWGRIAGTIFYDTRNNSSRFDDVIEEFLKNAETLKLIDYSTSDLGIFYEMEDIFENKEEITLEEFNRFLSVLKEVIEISEFRNQTHSPTFSNPYYAEDDDWGVRTEGNQIIFWARTVDSFHGLVNEYLAFEKKEKK